MNGETRRSEILKTLDSETGIVSATALAKKFGVSRQIIVQDIALLRATGHDILSFARGYRLAAPILPRRVFKVCHTDKDVQRELNLIVDMGGTVVDVFIYHRTYDTVRAGMNIRSRLDVKKFVSDLESGKSSLLSNATSGYHYHTVEADSEEMLDAIGSELDAAGFIAPLQEYEPPELTKIL